MNKRLLLVSVLLVLAGGLTAFALLRQSCASANAKPASSASSPTTGNAPADGVRTIEIRGGDTMKFDVTEIVASPGEKLRIVFINTGSQPKQAMGHNWVLLLRDTDTSAYLAAAISAADHDYLPPAHAGSVLAATRVLGPRERQTLDITAPAEPGRYPYVCSFPAHHQLGMKGSLIVR